MNKSIKILEAFLIVSISIILNFILVIGISRILMKFSDTQFDIKTAAIVWAVCYIFSFLGSLLRQKRKKWKYDA